jgi:sec-independent protein translocase protein TatB
VLALIVLGPEKLPRVVSEIGRWAGRARAMARQFREQLEEEVQLEQARKSAATANAAPPPAAEPPPVAPLEPAAPEPPPLPATFSHAHPTDASGADPTARAATSSADERGS